MAEALKRLATPEITVTHDYLNSELMIELDIPGADKEYVDLEMGEHGFCVKAEGKEVKYDSCATLAHEIVPQEARAKFDAGLLLISVPFREKVKGHKVSVE